MPHPYPGQQWRHGWIPLTAAARKSKNHNRTTGNEHRQGAETSASSASSASPSGASRPKPSWPKTSWMDKRAGKGSTVEKPAKSGSDGSLHSASGASPGEPIRHRTSREAVAWAKKNIPLPDMTADERDAVSRYTGRGYGLVNDGLRGKPPAHPKHRQLYNETIRDLDAALKKSKTPEPVVVHRNVGDAYLRALGVGDVEDGAQLEALVGKQFREPGYLSTSVGARSSNMRGSVDLSITVPKGYPALNLTQASGFAADERELLLGRGAKYVVREVRKGRGGRVAVEIEVLPPGRSKR